jgi:membrane-bound lytic murein transglycosylase D
VTARAHRCLWILAAVALGACATPPSQTDDPPTRAERSHADAADAQPAAADTPPVPVGPTRLARVPPLEPASPEDSSDAEDEAFADLLEQLRQGFGLPIVERLEVTHESERFARHPGHLERVLERARPYLPYVAQEIEARGLPGELAFLPVIESAFDPFAYSHGRAAGLWQIIPGTGSRFGLKQNWWYDGRRDVVESTRAALDYLEYLHGMFEGDWLLAIAAYNAGEGSVLRAIRSNRAAGRETDFWHLRLPGETRAYVPRLLGLAAVLADPEAHGLSLPEIPAGPAFTEVELDGQIDLAIAAELADIELSELQALNPGFNQWATDPDGPHRLLLPVEAAEGFSSALAELPADERVRWRRHQIRPGETLGGLARRYHTTVDVLQSVNGLKGTQIRAGAYLMIPVSTGG